LNLEPGKFFLISTHREENVDNRDNLKKIVEMINRLAETYSYPVIVSTHPRTRKRLEELPGFEPNQKVSFMKPFGFLDYVYLQQHAACVLSDSGTISEESAILSFPAISIRQSMERPEAQDAGTIILSGFDPQVVLDSVNVVINEFAERKQYKTIPADYMIDNTSWRVLKLILGNTKLSNLWHGVR
jgi:UDP-N-acetylglucosamine 2-epimerase (non-hydrolysing)